MKKEEMTEGRKAGWANKLKPGPLLSSKSGSATGNRPFATNDHMVQNPPCWRASSLLLPHWDIKTKASHA